MSCDNCNTNHPSESCPDIFRFSIDGTYLIPRCGDTPLPPLDLGPVVKEAETDTRLQLDIVNGNIVYTGEHATNGSSSADSIPILSIASLIDLDNLRDVSIPLANNGDLLSYNYDLGRWTGYTVPNGTIVTPVGVDADGALVKDGTGGTPQAPDTVPLGGTIIWPGEINAIPVSYRECNGAAISRSVYSGLFAIIGTKYGAGDGSTTFNLPDMRTRTVRGYSSTDTQFDTIGETGGSKTHTLSVAQMPPHTHSVNPPSTSTSSSGNHRHGATTGYGGNTSHSGIGQFSESLNPRSGTSTQQTDYAGNHSHTVNIPAFNSSSAGSGQAHNILGPYITMPYIMRVV